MPNPFKPHGRNTPGTRLPPSEPTPPPGMQPNYCPGEQCTCRMGLGYVACDQRPKWKPARWRGIG